MIIGIIGAMAQEVLLLRKKLTKITIWQQAGCKIYSGYMQGRKVALVQSGIGKVSAALGTTLLLYHFKPELVINIGSAGGIYPNLVIGNIVISDKVIYHDVDLIAFGYDIGQMAQCPSSFKAAPKLVKLAKTITESLGLHALLGIILSGDSFIHGGQKLSYIKNNFPQAIAVDMEATAIAHVCYRFSIPFVVIRSISDFADNLSQKKLRDNIKVVATNLSIVVAEMVLAIS
ncbi:5'-methylthioadenosine/S-adenosylhomocysteine nucleosidase [Candidatus Palibaumannia cicadellinicola]|uniref:5'-methylthioadenosine/S-adenosylhomocysteine nucleosidase n=1 Tax=Candidatus Palibaumannia cicadellinicola TaxID=186490 RepID=A0A0K2BL59_9GAMM|nr:5'-methylthioadenosine/S-adenosylhomocysteine nucleosidase [Candidatus Baumannia cicadellinicola]AKZ65793.1 5'-methylthioadenosine nucleosidase / S-adenosylhomocysteine nucleosidase [Candidatus Baumannia cicadellinicola]